MPMGLEVEGVKMKTTEKLVVPLERFSAEQIEQLRGLVGEVWIWNQNLNFGKLRFEKNQDLRSNGEFTSFSRMFCTSESCAHLLLFFDSLFSFLIATLMLRRAHQLDLLP